MKIIVESIPENWTNIQLIECFELSIGGANISSSEYSTTGIPVILKSDVQPMCNTTEPTKYVSQKIVKEKYSPKTLLNNDLLLCMRDLSQKAQILGLMTVGSEKQKGYLVAQGVTILRGCKINRKFISFFSNSTLYRQYILKTKRGSTQVHLGNDDIFKLALPLPPLLEQERIVAKIESTLKKINKIEDSVSEAEKLIAEYRESLFQKAFRGQLVPQDPTDEPATTLLQRIQSEGVKETSAKRKMKEEFQPISTNELPFAIPTSWEWIRLGSLFSVHSGENLTSEKQSKGDIPVFGGNGIAGYHREANLHESRIVIGRVGAKCGAIHITPEKSWVTDNALIVATSYQNIDMQWLAQMLTHLNLNSLSNSSAQPVISGSKIYQVLIPLPPLNEQRRIRVYLEDLEEKNNALQIRLESLRTLLRNQTISILNQAFTGKLVPQIQSEGTGHTLLTTLATSKTLKNKSPLKVTNAKKVKK